MAGSFFSIADIAIYPWAHYDRNELLTEDHYPNVVSWLERLDHRPSVKKAYHGEFKKT